MKSWEKLRNFWLVAALASSGFVLLKLSVTSVQKPQPPSYSFPASVALPGWQLIEATPIAVQKRYTPSLTTSLDDLTIAGKQYRYLRNGQPITVEMRYFGDYSSIDDILRETTVRLERIEFTPARSSVGAHAVYQRSNQLFMTACIPATRETTITPGEFRSAANRPDHLVNRLLPWFFGQRSLRDLRCLWTRISTPTNSAIATEPQLEQAWIEWVQWWQTHYPPES